MIALSLGQVADATGGRVEPEGSADALVTATPFVDSRSATPGGLFVAVVGERVDGHEFVEAALAAGAVATLASRPVPGPHVLVDDVTRALGLLARAVVDRLVVAGDLQVVGLTGSSGKTGTKDMLAHVLAAAGPTVATEGNLNNELGVPLTALRADEGTRHLVVEMGARGTGHIAYLAGLTPPRVGLVLNVGAAHASEFGTKADTARAKSELVQALPDADTGGVAVLNTDDPLVVAMADVTRARVVTFGLGSDADVRAEDVELDALGRASFTVVAGPDRARVALLVHGAHQVSNALGTLAVALELGLDLGDVAAALGSATARSRWRMEVTERADGVTIVNDAYNANPDSMRAGLEALAAMGRGDGAARRRTWAVLGEMLELGAASDDEHREVGRLTRRLGTDRLVVVGARARHIHDGAVSEGAQDGEDAVVVPDGDAARALLTQQLRPGDIVLFKSSRDAGLRWVGDAVAAAEPGDGVGP